MVEFECGAGVRVARSAARRALNNPRVVSACAVWAGRVLSMQGVERTDRELLDAGALVGHLVAEGSMFAFLAEYRRDVFADGEFEDLFPSGRGQWP
jgi:hypothetical protein